MKIINVIGDLCHGCGACRVACEYSAITEKVIPLGEVTAFLVEGQHELLEARMNVGVMSPVRVIKAAIKQIDPKADIAILDAPPGTSCPFIQTASASDYVILVTEPTPFGLSDLKQSVETLKKISKPYGVILNRSGLGNGKVQEYLHHEEIVLLLEIPFKKEIAHLYSLGKIVSETDSFFSRQLSAVMDNIIYQYGDSSNQR